MKAMFWTFTLLCFIVIRADNSGKNCIKELSSTGQHIWICCDNWEDRNGTCFVRSEQIYSLYKPTSVQYDQEKMFSEKPSIVYKGFLEREIIIYSIYTAVITALVLLGTLVLKRYRRERNFTSSHRFSHTVPSTEQAVMLENVTLDEIVEGLYETIDESNLVDLFHKEESDVDLASTSSGSVNILSIECNGYINPYQAIVPETDLHEYSFTHRTTDDSDSSGSYGAANGSGYFHPYQEIVTDVDVHEYILSVSSQTNQLPVSSNPCQTVLTSADSNIYFSVANLQIETETTNDSLTDIEENTEAKMNTNDRHFGFNITISTSDMPDNPVMNNRNESDSLIDNIPYIQISDLVNNNQM